MRIKVRLLSLGLVFVLVAALVAGVAVKTISESRAVVQTYTQASQNALRGETVNRYLVTIGNELRALYMAKSTDEARWRADQVDKSIATLNGLLTEWSEQVRPGELPEFEAVRPEIQKALAGSQNLARLGRDVSPAAAAAAGDHESFRNGRENMQSRMDAMIARLDKRLLKSRQALDSFQRDGTRTALIVAGGGMIALLVLSWVLAAGMAEQLRRIRKAIVAVSEGAYDTELPVGPKGDEIGEIWEALDILKARAIEADRLARQKLEDEHRLRELVLD